MATCVRLIVWRSKLPRRREKVITRYGSWKKTNTGHRLIHFLYSTNRLALSGLESKNAAVKAIQRPNGLMLRSPYISQSYLVLNIFNDQKPKVQKKHRKETIRTRITTNETAKTKVLDNRRIELRPAPVPPPLTVDIYDAFRHGPRHVLYALTARPLNVWSRHNHLTNCPCCCECYL